MPQGFWGKPPIAIAHRGGAGLYSLNRYQHENTLETFKEARRLGYEFLELDVTSTADRKVVVLHVTTDWFEALLHKPSAPNAKGLQKYTHRQLKEKLQRDVPTLSDIFKALPDTKFLIDSKTDEVVEPLAREIIRSKAYDRVFLNSFYIHRIKRLQEILGDKALYGLIIGRYPRLLNRKLLNLIHGRYHNAGLAAIVLPYRFANREIISFVHKNGQKAVVWSPNTQQSIEKVIAHGADGVISDNASLLKEIIDSSK